MLGGGGYTIRSVARCWTYETSVALGVEIANELPYNDYFEYYGPDFKLHISPSNMANQNASDYLDKIKTRLFENLRMLPHAPGVQMADIPEDAINFESEDDDKQNPDERISIRASDKRIACDEEFSDSEDEESGPRLGDRRHRENYRKRQRTVEAADGEKKEEKAGEKEETSEKKEIKQEVDTKVEETKKTESTDVKTEAKESSSGDAKDTAAPPAEGEKMDQ